MTGDSKVFIDEKYIPLSLLYQNQVQYLNKPIMTVNLSDMRIGVSGFLSIEKHDVHNKSCYKIKAGDYSIISPYIFDEKFLIILKNGVAKRIKIDDIRETKVKFIYLIRVDDENKPIVNGVVIK